MLPHMKLLGFFHTEKPKKNFFCCFSVCKKPRRFIWGSIYSCTIDGFFRIFKKAVSELICTRLYVVPVKSKGNISQNFVAFLEYMNFNFCHFQVHGGEGMTPIIQTMLLYFHPLLQVPQLWLKLSSLQNGTFQTPLSQPWKLSYQDVPPQLVKILTKQWEPE